MGGRSRLFLRAPRPEERLDGEVLVVIFSAVASFAPQVIPVVVDVLSKRGAATGSQASAALSSGIDEKGWAALIRRCWTTAPRVLPQVLGCLMSNGQASPGAILH
jgi:hypothetical protein